MKKQMTSDQLIKANSFKLKISRPIKIETTKDTASLVKDNKKKQLHHTENKKPFNSITKVSGKHKGYVPSSVNKSSQKSIGSHRVRRLHHGHKEDHLEESMKFDQFTKFESSQKKASSSNRKQSVEVNRFRRLEQTPGGQDLNKTILNPSAKSSTFKSLKSIRSLRSISKPPEEKPGDGQSNLKMISRDLDKDFEQILSDLNFSQ